MSERPVTDGASSKTTRRACLKGVAGFALAALGGLDQAAQAANQEAVNPGAASPGETSGSARAGGPEAMLAYVGCRTTKERNARGEGINVYRVDAATGAWTHVQLL